MSRTGAIVSEWMTTVEAADYLEVSPRTLEASRQKGRRDLRPGPPYHRTLGGIRYKRSELDEYRESQRVSSRGPLPSRPPQASS